MNIRSILGVWIFGCLVIFANLSIAQPDTMWTRTFGGTDRELGRSVQQTVDSGFIIAGDSRSFGAGSKDVYLIRTNSSGDTLWTRTYGGTTGDQGLSVQQTTDGGFIIAGLTNSFGAGSGDVYLIRTNSSGDTLWTRTYGGTASDFGNSVQQTTDSGFIIAGLTYSFGAGIDDVYLIRTNSSGDTLWTRTYGGTSWDWGYSVQQTTDSGFIIAGGTSSFGAGGCDVYLIRINSSGDTLWTKTYGGTDDENGYSVQQTTDSGFIIAGWTGDYGTNFDAYLIRVNSSGGTLWTRTYGTGSEQGNSVQQTTDSGFIIAGQTWSFGPGNGDVYLIRINSSGDTLWTKTYGGTDEDGSWSVQQTTDGGFIIAGYTWSFGAGNYDVWLLRIGPEPVNVEENAKLKVQDAKLECYPNPFIQSTIISYQLPDRLTTVSLKIYNVAGNLIHTLVDKQIVGTQFILSDNIVWHSEGLTPGIYFAKLNIGSHNLTKKLIFIR